MNKKLLFLVFFFVSVFSGKTQTVSMEEAMTVAERFLGKKQKSTMSCAKVVQQNADTLLYIFNSDRAFVVVSASKKTIPVLAYSEAGIFNEKDLIPPVAMWLKHYENQIVALKKSEAEAASHAVKSWKFLLENGKTQKSNTDEVLPFLRSQWGQGKMYNYYCPKDDSSSNNGRAVTGCVATAMAQLMYYFRFPQSGTGSYSYTHQKYGKLSANFATANYDYDAMCAKPADKNAAISLLMYHCGVAVDMVYGHSSSGMYNHKAAYALNKYFKFSPKTQYVFRDSTTLNWDSLIVWHLDRKIPLYYAGWTNPHTDGHAFICDGYRKDEQGNYYYHFDFGWDGNSNNYFYTDALIYGFNLAQELIIHAYPDTAKYVYPQPYNPNGRDTLTEEAGSFTDGSGIFSHHAQNRDFTWVILPDAEVIDAISFSLHYQLSTDDTLFVETDDPLRSNYVFTDTSASFSARIRGTQIAVRLKTLSGDDASGIFHASYATEYPSYCSFETKMQPTGTLSDGSGNKKYNNMTTCEKRIVLGGNSPYTALNVRFTKFETEENRDFLYIYDLSKKPKELLQTLSGRFTDSSFTFNTKSLSFIFETDERNVFDGWELSYTAGHIDGVNEWTMENGQWTIYPNPTRGKLTIVSAGATHALPVQCTVYNIAGQSVETPHATSLQDGTVTVDISHLTNGLYFLKVNNKVLKFLKE